jgi:TolB-like protein/Tfp pilus assembly protein PilF
VQPAAQGTSAGRNSLFGELKRRNVLRVAIAYLAAAWLLTEVASTLFPIFGVPEWGIRFIVILLALGFVPSLIFSWAYELTPEGLKRERDVVHEASVTHVTAKRLDLITISLVVVALLFIVADRLWFASLASKPKVEQTQSAEDDQQGADQPATAKRDLAASVAVLPFANRSADPNDAFFVEGIHDDLLTQLSKIGTIRTISRTSVMRYRDTVKPLPEIASELGVAHILEGGVQRAGDKVRINVQLIDANSDEHLWAERYDRKLSASNLFTIQSEIAEAIAEALHAAISPGEQQRIRATPTENLEAYEAYLLGRQRYNHSTESSLRDAVGFFRKAVELDPGFAMAWVGLADTYIQLAGDRGFPIGETQANAETALETALELDKELGEAYTSFIELKIKQNDLEGALQNAERAMELSPNYPPLSGLYGILQSDLGQTEEGLRWREAAVQMDPMSAELRRSYAIALRELGRTEDALAQLQVALEIDPLHPGILDAIATIQWQVFNQLDRAVQNYSQSIAQNPESDHYVWLAQLYLDLSEPTRAGLLLERANELGPGKPTTHWGKLLLKLITGTGDDITGNARVILETPISAPWHAIFVLAQLSRRASASGRYDDALAVYSQNFPDLLQQSKPYIHLENYRAAIDLAWLLQKVGDHQKADRLLELSHDFIQGQPRLGWWGGYWVADVQILALQGRKADALAALQEAVDEGWRSLWWYYLRHDPSLDSIRDEPEFKQALAEIEADVSEQMDRVREMEERGEIPTINSLVSSSTD